MRFEDYSVKDHLQDTRMVDLYYTFSDYHDNRYKLLERLVTHYYNFLKSSDNLTSEQQQDLNSIKEFYDKMNSDDIKQQLKQDYKECE